METNELSIQIPEFTDKGNPSKRQKVFSKPKSLFKMKIGDLQSLEYDPDGDCFKFRKHDLSLVMCGGEITDIFRDDHCFSFEIDDGSGKITCFHKFKYDREALLKKLSELPTSAQFLQTSFCPNLTRTSDETVFNVTNDVTAVRNRESDTGEAFRTILSWFQEEIVEKSKSRNVGDYIHVTGILLIGDGIRKIIVHDFRMATKEDREDLSLEIDYLNQCVY